MGRKFLLLFSKRSAFLLYFTCRNRVGRASGSFLKKRTKKLLSAVPPGSAFRACVADG
jgi:hypothetical protein